MRDVIKHNSRLARLTMLVCKPISQSLLAVTLAALAASVSADNTGSQAGDESKAKARVHYMLQCQGCHLSNGRGTKDGVPDMTTHGAALLQRDDGRRFFIQVPGSSNAALTNVELANVLNYIVDEIIGSEEVAHFTEAEIVASRGRPINDVEQHRQDLIDSLVEP